MEGSGLSYIMQRAIDYHKQHPENFWVSAYQPPTIYNDNSKEHRNVVFADTLEAIENIVLFSISNYFLRFSNEYKKIHDVDEFDNNWYEYVEFGTTNPLTILLQRNGFSRESATFIKKHKDEYVAHDGSTDELRLRLSLLDCGMNCMKTDDSYEKFVQAVSQLNATAKKWKNYKRILTLAKNNSKYLTQEIQKEFSGQFFQCRDESETLRAVHMIEVHGLYSALRKDILNDLSFSAGILKMDPAQMKNLIEFLNSHDGFHLEELPPSGYDRRRRYHLL